ncbi:uncharacterized protein LOC106673484 isoform X2 [Cimex lectularius]|nr:uncharacterized protein LOC106673484 isoform X2 [Cimex lectularius]XP_014261114.1 uncharacterized protein LOC106673484 isoform X2 [Cimex lectularius]
MNYDDDEFKQIKFGVKFSSMQRHSSMIDLLHQMINAESSGAIQIAWTVFLKELEEEMKDSKQRIRDLERSVKQKSRQLDENAYAFEELQSQLNDESDKMIVQERAKFTKIISELKSRLEDKEKEVEELMEFKQDIVDRFNAMFRQKKRSKIKKAELLKQQEDMLQEIELQKEVIDHLKKALNESKDELDKERIDYYKKGIEKGREMAYHEEIGVLKQLEILKNIQLILEMDLKQQKKEIFEDD